MSRCWNFTAPSSGRMTPTTRLKVVVLPAPFGPSKPTISPAETLMDTPLTTRRWRYSFTSFSVASSGSDAPAATARTVVFSPRGSVCGSIIRPGKDAPPLFFRIGPEQRRGPSGSGGLNSADEVFSGSDYLAIGAIQDD